LPPVSTPLAANLSTRFASVVDTCGKFATGVNDTGGKSATGVNDANGKLPLVSTTQGAKLPPVSWEQCWWQTMGTIIKLLTT
jgi:hypothetical protein